MVIITEKLICVYFAMSDVIVLCQQKQVCKQKLQIRYNAEIFKMRSKTDGQPA